MVAAAHFPEVEKAVNYFNENRSSIVHEFPGQYVVIADDKVIKAFPTYFLAYQYIGQRMALGTFGIFKAVPEDESISARICNRYMI